MSLVLIHLMLHSFEMLSSPRTSMSFFVLKCHMMCKVQSCWWQNNRKNCCRVHVSIILHSSHYNLIYGTKHTIVSLNFLFLYNFINGNVQGKKYAELYTLTEFCSNTNETKGHCSLFVHIFSFTWHCPFPMTDKMQITLIVYYIPSSV